MQHGKFPHCFKVAKIIPIHKRDKSNVGNNYRPTSMLSTLSKLINKVLRLVDFFENTTLLMIFNLGFERDTLLH